ncbi:MAG: OB-fold nucleic acid binding domain-containing protein [Caldilineaceae bacterium]
MIRSLTRPVDTSCSSSVVLHGKEEVEYKHVALEPILAETYGIIVYQEQIIQVLSQLAGYTPGEADLVRRAIGKKKASEIERHKQIFVDGCGKKGIPAKTATAIYEDIEFFARYGFNKSHAADYAVITVQTAYLKAHYPVEYMAALLLVERDKTEKVVNFINECRRMGIQVLPPDINYSGMDFETQAVPAESAHQAISKDPTIAYNFPVPEGAAIRFGMAAVKNVGEGPVGVILEERAANGRFRSLEDLCDRVDLRHVNKRALECLIKVGALDRFGNRSQLLAVLDQMMARSAATHTAKDSGQISMFDLLGDAGEPQEVPIELPKIEETSSKERLQWEKELLGVFASSHPIQQLKVDLMQIVTCSCAELSERHHDKVVTVGGMLADVRTTITKKGDKMAFLRLEDMVGQCEVVLFPRTYEQYKDELVPDRVLLVIGKAQTRNGRTSVLGEELKTSLEIARAVVSDEDNRYQDRLLDAPTFNGRPGNGNGNGHPPAQSNGAPNGHSVANGAANSNGVANGNGHKPTNGNGHAANGNTNGNADGHTTPKASPPAWTPNLDGYDADNAPVMGEESPFAHDFDWMPEARDRGPGTGDKAEKAQVSSTAAVEVKNATVDCERDAVVEESERPGTGEQPTLSEEPAAYDENLSNETVDTDTQSAIRNPQPDSRNPTTGFTHATQATQHASSRPPHAEDRLLALWAVGSRQVAAARDHRRRARSPGTRSVCHHHGIRRATSSTGLPQRLLQCQ